MTTTHAIVDIRIVCSNSDEADEKSEGYLKEYLYSGELPITMICDDMVSKNDNGNIFNIFCKTYTDIDGDIEKGINNLRELEQELLGLSCCPVSIETDQDGCETNITYTFTNQYSGNTVEITYVLEAG